MQRSRHGRGGTRGAGGTGLARRGLRPGGLPARRRLGRRRRGGRRPVGGGRFGRCQFSRCFLGRRRVDRRTLSVPLDGWRCLGRCRFGRRPLGRRAGLAGAGLARGLGLAAHPQKGGDEAAPGIGLELGKGLDAECPERADHFVEVPKLPLEVALAECLLEGGQLDDDALAPRGGRAFIPSALARRAAIARPAPALCVARTPAPLWNLTVHFSALVSTERGLHIPASGGGGPAPHVLQRRPSRRASVHPGGTRGAASALPEAPSFVGARRRRAPGVSAALPRMRSGCWASPGSPNRCSCRETKRPLPGRWRSAGGACSTARPRQRRRKRPSRSWWRAE